MIPSINSLNLAVKENKFFNKEGIFKSPTRPKKSVHSKTSLMDEIFLRKSKIVYPAPAFPKFYTYHEGAPKTDSKKKRLLTYFEKVNKASTSFQIKPERMQAIAAHRRRSSWSVMKNLIKGVSGLMHPEVFFIKNENELEKNIQSEMTTPIKIFKKKEEEVKTENGSLNLENAKKLVHNEKAEIFHNIKLREKFFHMVQKGSPKDLERIKNILEKDPSKFIRSNSDPERLVNKANKEGKTPIYVACLNGNFEVVKLLLTFECNPHALSRIDANNYENILAVSARWNHIKIVEFLLKNIKWSQKEIQDAILLSENSNATIKDLLKINLRRNSKKVSLFRKCIKCFFK